jgi:hypothetical protein
MQSIFCLRHAFIIVLVAFDLLEHLSLVRLFLEKPAMLPRIGRLPGLGLRAILRLEALNQLRLRLPLGQPGRQVLTERCLVGTQRPQMYPF